MAIIGKSKALTLKRLALRCEKIFVRELSLEECFEDGDRFLDRRLTMPLTPFYTPIVRHAILSFENGKRQRVHIRAARSQVAAKPMVWWPSLYSILCTTLLVCWCENWPGERWIEVGPEQVGMSRTVLAQLPTIVGGSGCVVRNGLVCFRWGTWNRARDVASAGKPVYGHFLLLALQSGKIEGLDEPVLRYEPRLGELNPELGYKDRRITWRHLVTQTSCYGVREAPGSAFDYNDWQMALFWDLLFLKVYGASYETVDDLVLGPLLAQLIGCEDRPTFLAFGPKDRPGRLAISPRDFCRFGLLYLRNGRWRVSRLLAEDLVRLVTRNPLPATFPRTSAQPAQMLPGQRSIGSRRIPDDQTDHFGSYSYLWWVNGEDRSGQRFWPGISEQVFAALGHDGESALFVIPSLDLVVSWNEARIIGRADQARAIGLLIKAARGDGSAEGGSTQ